MLRLTIATAMALSLSLAVLAPVSAQDKAAPAADKSARAQEILKQARAALGDEAKLKALQSLTASGTSRRSFGERQVESEVEIDILLPDKVKRIESGQFGSNTTALNGTQIWTEFVPAVGGPGGGGGGFQVFRGGGGDGNVSVVGPGGGGGGQPTTAQTQAQTMIQQLQRGEMTRLMLGLLLLPPAGVNLEFTYSGSAKAPDGMTADIIEAKGEGFTARLFLDQSTHHLLMIGFKSRQFRGRPGGARAGGAGGGAGGGPGTGQGAGRGTGAAQGSGAGQGTGAGQGAGQGTGQGAGQAAGGAPTPGGQGGGQQQPQMTPEERDKRIREAMERAPEVDVRLAFADYKSVNGISLPHRIVRSEGGTPTEETDISKYKINPSLKADKFEKKEKK